MDELALVRPAPCAELISPPSPQWGAGGITVIELNDMGGRPQRAVYRWEWRFYL